MRLTSLALRQESGIVRAEAVAVWEDSDRPPFPLFVEASERFADRLWPDPNACLIASILPAWNSGERRILVEAPLCPVLLLNLRTAVAVLRSWYPDLGRPPVVEAPALSAAAPAGKGAISLMSCGIDSLTTLRWNKLHLPDDHPAAIRAVLPMLWSEHASKSLLEFDELAAPAVRAAEPVAVDAGVELIPVVTNMYWLTGDGYFYDKKWHGAVLASVAGFLSHGYNLCYIASSYRMTHHYPWGSHPMLDNNYSSAHFRVDHHAVDLSRLEKTAIVAEWPTGLGCLRVCQKGDGWSGNCGRCEKCLRTMTSLVALGKLQDCPAFPMTDVTTAMLEKLGTYQMATTAWHARWYRELLPLLENQNRSDLAMVLDRVLAKEDLP